MIEYPIVVRSDNYSPPVIRPERVVKHEWGVICIDGSEKVSYPWHEIRNVKEEIEI